MVSNPTKAEFFMRRCLDLARMGRAGVSPNPMVGAVLVHNEKIIGEGFHQVFGAEHAEVNAISSVPEEKRHLIPEATLYVSLEPCCFHGKTPACTDLIRFHRIKKVVIAALDPTPEVNGQGVDQLRQSGVEVITGVLEEEGKALIERRQKFVTTGLPWITLKFAQTQGGLFAPLPLGKTMISAPLSQRWVHKMRAEADAIMVGMHTALVDNPELTTRLYPGKSPLRVIVGNAARLRPNMHIFNADAPTLIYHTGNPEESPDFLKDRLVVLPDVSLSAIMQDLAQRNIGHLLVEGGSQLLSAIIAQELWDEAWVIRGNVFLPAGIPAPFVPGTLMKTQRMGRDEILAFRRKC